MRESNTMRNLRALCELHRDYYRTVLSHPPIWSGHPWFLGELVRAWINGARQLARQMCGTQQRPHVDAYCAQVTTEIGSMRDIAQAWINNAR